MADRGPVNAPRASEDDYAHCQALVRASDKDRFVATLFAPVERRPHLFALYAFNLEIARIGEIAHEPLAGEIRLQWWHDCLSGGDAAGHPVASALLDSIERRGLAREPLLDLIDARRFDVYAEPMGPLGEF
ncbi:MAG: squalene/phytoene synthase family protein, partial [Xanthobacteraceae bacterium]|nr:squalene/phytoene synthase family protein [Xanthobacteraceae bacterium]